MVNHTVGMNIVDDCENLGIQNLFIQPGAESEELVEKALCKGMNIHKGCVLVELEERPAPSL